jgi:hypothetical protein
MSPPRDCNYPALTDDYAFAAHFPIGSREVKRNALEAGNFTFLKLLGAATRHLPVTTLSASWRRHEERGGTTPMSALFSSGLIGGLELENRIVVSPMCQYSAVDGVAQPWHLIHVGSLMMSAGLAIMEATAVEEIGRGTHGCLGLHADRQQEVLAGLVREARKLSAAKLGIQLTHSGRKASTRTIPERWRGEPLPSEEGAWTPVAPSALPFDRHWPVPDELDEEGIGRIVSAFANSAKRALRAGFDLIEIHSAHGYLIHNFLSPLSNKRTESPLPLAGMHSAKCSTYRSGRFAKNDCYGSARAYSGAPQRRRHRVNGVAQKRNLRWRIQRAWHAGTHTNLRAPVVVIRDLTEHLSSGARRDRAPPPRFVVWTGALKSLRSVTVRKSLSVETGILLQL